MFLFGSFRLCDGCAILAGTGMRIRRRSRRGGAVRRRGRGARALPGRVGGQRVIRGDGAIGARSGLEGNPPGRGEPRFRPGVRILVGDQIAAVGLSGPRNEADHNPGGDAERSQQHGHRGGELLTVTTSGLEQELGQSPVLGRGSAVEVVDEVGVVQVVLDRHSLLVAVRAGRCYVTGEFSDPRVGVGRQLRVNLQICRERPR